MNNQHKTIDHCFALCAAMAFFFSFVFCACSNDENIAEGGGEDDVVFVDDNDDSTPTIDEMKVKSYLRTYVVAGNYRHSGKALVKRLQDVAEVMDASVQTFIVDNNSVATLTDLDYRNMALLVARGGNLVICQPTKAVLKTMAVKLKDTALSMYQNQELTFNDVGFRAFHRLLLMFKENKDFSPAMTDNIDSNDILFDLLALRGDMKHAVTDVTEQEKENANNPPTDYLYGKLADETAEWLDRRDDNKERMAKGRLLMAQQANGPQEIYDNISTTDQFEYAMVTRTGHKRAIMKLQYNVWAVNDTKGYDYYLLQQEIVCTNDQFNFAYDDKKKWTSYKVRDAVIESLTYAKNPSKTIYAHWPYLKDLSTNVKFSDGSASIKDISPTQIDKGSTTYTQTTHMSLSVAFLNPEIKGGLDMTNSVTRTIPDISTDFKLGKDAISPQWSYAITQQPKIIKKFGSDIWQHDVAKPSYHSTFIVGHSWIWKVKHNDKTFSFDTHVTLNMEALWYDNIFCKSGYHIFPNHIDVTYQLTPPSRYEQVWLMVMKERNDDDYNYMKEYVRNFESKFSLNTVKNDDRYEIGRRMDSIAKDLSTHKDIFLERNIKPFQLRFIPNDKTDAIRVYDVNFSASPAVKINKDAK